MKADGAIIIDTAIQDDGFEAGTKELENAARRVAQKVSSLGNKIKVAINKQLNSFVKLNEAYARQEEKVNELRKAVEAYANQKIPTQEYREIQAQIDEARKKMIGLINAQERYLATGGKQNSNVYRRRQYDIQELANTIKYAEGELRDLEETGKAFTLGNNTKKAADAAKKLQSEEEKLNDMNRRLNTSYASLKNRVQEYTSSAAGSSRTTRNISRSVSGLASGISNAGKKIQRFTVSAGKAVKGLAAAMLGLNKNTNRAQMSMGRMLAMSIMFSAVFRLISAVTGGIGEGMSNLAQYSDETNQSISTLMSSLTRLKNSFATAFAPILNVVAPALTAFIDLISRAITYVGMLIAALTGQDSFIRAVGVQEDYAGSLEDTAGAAQDAEKALNGYMSPLDKINRYEDGKNNSGSGSDIPGYVAPTPGEMFETVPIENSIKDIADKIKKLIQAQDWAGIGEFIADGLNKGLEKVWDIIRWDNIGPKITSFVNAFTEAFNSLVNNIDWDMLGRSIGDGVNTIVKTLNMLIEGINWTNLGSKVATGIYGMFYKINWNELGNLIGNKFMILWNFLYGLVSNLPWSRIGTSIGNAINGAIEKINPTTIGAAISDFAIGLLDTFINAVSAVNWTKVGQKIADLLKSINWSGLASKLFKAGLTLMEGLLKAFNQLPGPVKVAGVAIAAFFGIVKGMTVINTMANSIKKLIQTGTDLKNNWTSLKNAATTVWTGIRSVITAASSGIGGIAKSLISTVKSITSAFNPLYVLIAALVGSVAALIMNWSRMSTLGRFVGVLGALAIAAGTLAVALGAVKGAVGAGLVVAAITGGVASVTYAISTAKRQASSMQLSTRSVPYLATGAVIPPNAPFVAVLGDQRKGTNIETPESLLRKIVREELRGTGKGGNYRFTAQINRRTLFDEMISEAKMRKIQTGNSPFETI